MATALSKAALIPMAYLLWISTFGAISISISWVDNSEITLKGWWKNAGF